jgi:hypothetical protein
MSSTCLRKTPEVLRYTTSLIAYKGDNRDTQSVNTSVFVRRSLLLSLTSQPKSQQDTDTLAIKRKSGVEVAVKGLRSYISWGGGTMPVRLWFNAAQDSY